MGIGVQHKNVRKTALPRTGRTLDAVGGGGYPSAGSVSSTGGSSVVEGNFEIIEGEGISVDKQSTGSLIYKISHGNTSEGESTANEGTFVVKNVIVDTFGHVTGVESDDMGIIFDGKYLRKDKPDQTDYLLGLNGGATFGNYVGGFLGSGGIIDEKGYAELMGLTLREFLEVPELRFNRIDVISGETWNAIAFGLIESVDEVNRIVTLKLEEGELSGMHLSDFCRGIFHNLTDNATQPGKDSAGFEVMVGFSTSYFTPVEIIDNAHFRYELKPGSTVHPCPFMKFAVYGNPVDKSRQASAYSTRTYQRYLVGVDTWEITPKNVSMQFGDLSNLVINGESLAGGSVYLNNVYFGGNILTVGGLDNGLKGKDAYSVTLSTYSAVFNTRDEITDQMKVVSGNATVVTGSDIVVASSFRISTRIQATKGEKPLRYSTVVGEGKYLVSATGDGCTFTVTDGMIVVHSVTAEKAVIKIDVNCEGIAVYEQEFTIVSVTDGIDGTDIEWIYQRTATEAGKPSKPVSENIDDFVPEGWTDDPVGTTIDMPYEWSCKREKNNGVWGEFSDVFLWLKFGKDGKEIEYIYRRTSSASRPSTPGTSQTDDFVPEGWTDDPVGPNASYPYEWVSVRKKVNGVWGSFSLPALSAKYSFDGQDGRPGIDGGKGDTGIQGPALNYCGDWSSTTTYYKNDHLVDVVSVRDSSGNPTFYFLLNSSSRNQYPGSYPSVWEVQNSFKGVATDLLFADKATISRWTFSNYYIYSNNLSACFNGSENADVPLLAVGVNGQTLDSRGLIPDSASPGGYKVNPKAALKIYKRGILTVGEGIEDSNAGISGVGSAASNPAPIRFWAGSTYDNRFSAPFRVDHFGNLVANNCNLTGSFQTAGNGTRIYISTESVDKLLRIYNPSNQAVMSLGYDTSNNYTVLALGKFANSGIAYGTRMSTAGFDFAGGNQQFSVNAALGGELSVIMKTLPTISRGTGYLYRDSNGYVKVGL